MDLERIRLRIRHFLLQQSKLYNRKTSKDADGLPAVSAMAKELSGNIRLSPRRLQKYLSKVGSPKDLSITLTDLHEFARAKGDTLSEFMAYLLQEQLHPPQNSTQAGLVNSFNKLHEGHRRALSATIFSGENIKTKETVIEICLKAYSLDAKDLQVIVDVVNGFHEKSLLKSQK